MPVVNSSFWDTENSSDRRDLNKFADATFEGMADTNAWGNANGNVTFGAITDEESIKNWFDQSGFEMSPFGFLAKPDTYGPRYSDGNIYDPNAVAADVRNARGDAMRAYPKFDGREYRRGMNRLEGVFGDINDAFDAKATIDASNKANAALLLSGQQSADSVARSYRESLNPGSSGDIGARMLRAKALLPVLTQTAQNKVDTQKYADSSKRDAVRLSADLATQMGDLSLNYTNTLARYNSDKAQNALGYAQLAQNRADTALQGKLHQDEMAYKYDYMNQSSRDNYINRIYDGIDRLNSLASSGGQSSGGNGYTEGALIGSEGRMGATERYMQQSPTPAPLNLKLYGLGSSHDQYSIW